ncbi:hypothetical protein [Maribacter antarcticus]|uniref:hypothetical protein n=1 Tax=Maribacter antarcticus TaxID=505250 RepID=UPI0012ECA872|nr:hypothetical protein [Maribacter antarcticus]
MNNKIKSLIYLSCFIFASVLYNATNEENIPELSDKMELTQTNQVANTHSEDLQQHTIN